MDNGTETQQSHKGNTCYLMAQPHAQQSQPRTARGIHVLSRTLTATDKTSDALVDFFLTLQTHMHSHTVEP